jgi:hypothetical protein
MTGVPGFSFSNTPANPMAMGYQLYGPGGV